MKKLLIALLLLSGASLHTIQTHAQPVPKTVLVEHFTNTFCSICAGRNPGFYQNLAQFPQVLYVSYYPSAPYPACPLNQYNKPEADARTNYYGVYGGTPRLVIQGAAIPANANYSSATIIQSELGNTTPFAASLRLKTLNATTGEARFVIRKMDTSALDSLSLYVAVVEDTLVFSAANGEQNHYNVFRRSVWGQQPLRVKAPAAIGDSVVAVQSFPIDAAWTLSKMFAVGVVQQKNGALIQAARSAKLSAGSSTTGIAGVGKLSEALLYPNPARDVLHIANAEGAIATVYNMYGQRVLVAEIGKTSAIPVSQLANGPYLVHLTDGLSQSNIRFTKQ